MIKPAIHDVASCEELQRRRYALWTLTNCFKTISIMKWSHPIISWDIASSCMIGSRSSSMAHSKHVIELRPRRYHRSRCCMSGYVLLHLSHRSILLVDCLNAKVRPTAGQRATCWQVSLHVWQLGQSLHLPSWWNKNAIVLAMLLMCFTAHIWNNRSRMCSVPQTGGQSILSNCSWDSIPWLL